MKVACDFHGLIANFKWTFKTWSAVQVQFEEITSSCDFYCYNCLLIVTAILKPTQSHRYQPSALSRELFDPVECAGFSKNGLKKQFFCEILCPILVPICIIKAIGIKIPVYFSADGSFWTVHILVVCPWNWNSIISRFFAQIHDIHLMVSVSAFNNFFSLFNSHFFYFELGP